MESLDKKSLKEKQAKEKKWLKMVLEWDGEWDKLRERDNLSGAFPDELKNRIWQGCPDSLRGRVWPLMLRIKEIKKSNERQFGRHIYEVRKQLNIFVIFSSHKVDRFCSRPRPSCRVGDNCEDLP